MSWGWNHNCPRGAAGRQAAGDTEAGMLTVAETGRCAAGLISGKGENPNGRKMLRERGTGTGRGQRTRSPDGSQRRTCLDRGPSLTRTPQPSSEGKGPWRQRTGVRLVVSPWCRNYSPGGVPWWPQGMNRGEAGSWVFNVEEMMGLPGPGGGRPHPGRAPKSKDFYRETSSTCSCPHPHPSSS